ncbi:SpoVR family protein [Limnochorda pilosa]|uniref:Stage V sporulation protein R n=1 Tax=Limnochorda pilosa TaxID=1555112 RepID=A0A0K2SPK2_LIMPI|nr:SpoVR family protein [Limnochorda pilosa]BAS29050.1 stage V sporulation protein R [Limnochorda pilosa]
MTPAEIGTFEQQLERIERQARAMGLDFFPVRFELVPAEVMYTFGAYGMPHRFTHWSFGKAYQRMKTQYDYNLSRIYELVINSDPAYAFLLEGNSLLQNLVVAAHVLAHVDFFKNNRRFQHTSRTMVESMAVDAERMRAYEFTYGREAVEAILDAALAIQDQVDPYGNPWRGPEWRDPKPKVRKAPGEHDGGAGSRQGGDPYSDLWALDRYLPGGDPRPEGNRTGAGGTAAGKEAGRAAPGGPPHRTFPERPVKDLVRFVAEESRVLEPWQRDVLFMVRQEMLYFWPQMETKIMNEGWASFFHVRLMRSLDLSEADAVEFARMHAGVVQPSPYSINPYLMGLKLFESIERRWNEPTLEERERFGRRGGEGRSKIFEVRETETDVSFLRNYLTRELVEELDLYLYAQVDGRWQVVEKDWEKVRDHLVAQLTHCGVPYIVVEDGDYQGRGELLLQHRHEGLDLDARYAQKTLEHVYRLWGKPVHLATRENGKDRLHSFDGQESTVR